MPIEKNNASIGSIVEYLNDPESSSRFGIDNIAVDSSPYKSFIAQAKDGFLYEWGTYQTYNLLAGKDVTGFSKININYESGVKYYTRVGFDTFILLNNGDLYTYGYNKHGGCGNGTTSPITKPTKIMTDVDEVFPPTNMISDINYYWMFVKKTDNSYWGWGEGTTYNRIGTEGDDYARSPTKLVHPNDDPVFDYIVDLWNIGGQYGTTYVKTHDGRLYGCGSNISGCMGIANSSTNGYGKWRFVLASHVNPSNLIDIQGSRASNNAFTVFLTTDGVYSCGNNDYGQLGLTSSDTGDESSPQEIDNVSFVEKIWVTGGNKPSVFAQRQSNFANSYAWGYNAQGQLGNGNNNNVFSPFPKVSFVGGGTIVVPNSDPDNNNHTVVSYIRNRSYGFNVYSDGSGTWGIRGDGSTVDLVSSVSSECILGDATVKQVFLSNNGSTSQTMLIVMDDGRMFGCGYGGYNGIYGMFNTSKYNTNTVPRLMC